MIRTASIALLAFGLTAAFAASDRKMAGGSDEQQLKTIETQWAAALMKADQATIDRFVSPDWKLTTPDGNLLTKEQADSDLKAGTVKFESTHLDDVKVQITGDTAIVFGLTTEKSSYKDKDTSGQYRFTDVFVKQHGQWKCIATHVSKVVSQM